MKRVLLGEVVRRAKLRNLGPAPGYLFDVEIVQLGQLLLLRVHDEISFDPAPVAGIEAPRQEDRQELRLAGLCLAP